MRWIAIGIAVGVFAAGVLAALALHERDEFGATLPTLTTETTVSETTTEEATETTDTSATPFGKTYEAIAERLEDFEPANIAFNAPTTLERGETAVIQLLLSLSETTDELQAELTEVGEQRGASVQVSEQMIATLEGDEGLTIKPTVPTPVRLVTPGTTAEWKWLVTPTRKGNLLLYLTLYAVVTVDGAEYATEFRTFQETIAIDVTWNQRLSGFVGDNWQWLWTTILFPLAALAWAAWRRRRASHVAT